MMRTFSEEMAEQSRRIAHFTALLQNRAVTVDDLYTLHQLLGAGKTIQNHAEAAITAIHEYLAKQITGE